MTRVLRLWLHGWGRTEGTLPASQFIGEHGTVRQGRDASLGGSWQQTFQVNIGLDITLLPLRIPNWLLTLSFIGCFYMICHMYRNQNKHRIRQCRAAHHPWKPLLWDTMYSDRCYNLDPCFIQDPIRIKTHCRSFRGSPRTCGMFDEGPEPRAFRSRELPRADVKMIPCLCVFGWSGPLSLYLKLWFVLFTVACMCVYLRICTCVCNTWGGQKKVSDPL